MNCPSQNKSVRVKTAIVLCVMTLLPSLWVVAAGPGWWSQRGVLDNAEAHDYGPANFGQLKNSATKAFDEITVHAPGGIGSMTAPSGTGYRLTQFVNSWSTPQTSGTRLAITGSNTNNYGPINLGQLKNVAIPFYDRLKEIGYTNSYPWENSSDLPDNYGIANIGQMKNIFSFDLTFDGDGDGLPDWWERYRFNGQMGATGNGDEDGDGWTNAQEFQGDKDPHSWDTNGTGTVQDSDGDGMFNIDEQPLGLNLFWRDHPAVKMKIVFAPAF